MEKIKPTQASVILSNRDPKKAGYLMSELGKRRHLLKEGGDAKGIPQSVPIPSSGPSLPSNTSPAANTPSPQRMTPQPSTPVAPQSKASAGSTSPPPPAAIPPSELPPFASPKDQTQMPHCLALKRSLRLLPQLRLHNFLGRGLFFGTVKNTPQI
jgi:hypothetical protein